MASGRPFGVSGVVLLNAAIGSGYDRMYANGKEQTFATRPLGKGTEDGSATPVPRIGSSTSTTGRPFLGNLQELIVFAGDAGTPMNGVEVAKINSYLAIKYGVTLDAGNYVNSSGEAVWNRAQNIGYSTSVFGLARDSQTKLYQKQSHSSEAQSTLTAWVGTLAALNRDNAATLPDGAYLMFSSNGKTGFTNLSIQANAGMHNGALPHQISIRMAEIFRTQLSGVATLSGVNLKTTDEADVLLVSSTPDFVPAQTSFYAVNTDGTVSVPQTFNNTDVVYLTFAKYQDPAPFPAYTKELWLKADALALAHAAVVNPWTDNSGLGRNFTGTGSPKFNRNTYLMNFQPSVHLETTAQYLQRAASTDFVNTSKAYYTFIVSRKTGGGASIAGLFTPNDNVNNATFWAVRNPAFNTGSATSNIFARNNVADLYGITAVIRPNSADKNQQLYFNGNSRSYLPATFSPTTSGVSRIGRVDGTGNAFLGQIQEILVYSTTAGTVMKPVEVQQVNSYLALKYGLTLELGDYIINDGTVVWNRGEAVDAAGIRYESQVFGIGRDDAMGLHIKQARAFGEKAVTSSPFAVSVNNATGFAQLNTENSGSIASDMQFVLFSATDASEIRPITEISPGSFSNATLTTPLNFGSAVFKTQMTGLSTTMLKFLHYWTDFKANTYLLISSTPDFVPAQTRLHQFDINTSQLDNIQVNDGEYLLLATYSAQQAPAGVLAGLRMWLRADVESSITPGYPPTPVAADPDDVANREYDVMAWHSVFSPTTPSPYTATYSFIKRVAAPISFAPGWERYNKEMNYHPAVTFHIHNAGTNDDNVQSEYLSTSNGPMSVAAPQHYTYITLYNNEFGASYRSYVYGFGRNYPGWTADGHPAFGLQRTDVNLRAGVGRFAEDGGAGAGDVNTSKKTLYTTGTTTSFLFEGDIENKIVWFEVDGLSDSIVRSSFGGGHQMNGPGTLGVGSYSNRSLEASMGETFAYERALSVDEKNAIYSYLGLKYGITVDINGEGFDYKLSDRKTTVWPGASDLFYRKYHDYISALVRDDNAGVNNIQTRSTKYGGVMWMAVTENGVKQQLDNGEFIVCGADSLSGKIPFKPTDDICIDAEERLRRVWMIDNASSLVNPTLTIRMQNHPETFPYNAGHKVYMLVAYDADSLFAGTIPGTWDDATHRWTLQIPGEFINGEHQFSLVLDHRYTFVTFAAKPDPAGVCGYCNAFTGAKTMKFTTAEFPRTVSGDNNKSVLRTANLGSGITANFSLQYTGGTGSGARRSSGYPRVGANSSWQLSARQLGKVNPGGKETTTITLSTPLAASFEIYDIDAAGSNRDVVTIYGMCDNTQVLPRLSYVQSNPKLRAFTISGNIATGNKKGTSYSNIDSRLRVDFDLPVGQIVIVHEAESRSTGGANLISHVNDIGVGPITFSCPPPPPPVNEDGLSFSKEAPEEAYLCEEIVMTYRLFNANCNPKPVNFRDILPSELSWIGGSVTLSHEDAVQLDTHVNSYGNTQTLQIDNLYIPGFTTLIVTAKAKFESSAVAGNYYGSNGRIDYIRIINDLPNPAFLISCDRYLGCGELTKTKALASPLPILEKITVTATASKACYKENDVITYSITATNPNTVSLTAYMSIILPEGFDNLSSVTGTCEGTVSDGPIICEITGITLPASGTYTYELKIKAPDTSGLIQLTDEDGNPLFDEKGKPVYMTAVTSVAFMSEADDVCQQIAFSEADIELETPYCNAPSAIITNKNVTVKMKK
jgi:hypothetical protein